MRCIVVGAGIIGVTVAFRLARHGHTVTLLDRARPGSSTTGTSFAWVNASSKEPSYDYFRLNECGMSAHRRLINDMGDNRWMVPTGNLTWETDSVEQERLAAQAQRMVDWGYDVQPASRADMERLEPDLLVPPEVQEGVFFPTESFLYTSLYLACVLRAARETGVTLHFGDEVADFTLSGNTVTGVVLRSGEKISADIVICCCGKWTTGLISAINFDLPLVSPDIAGSQAVGLLVGTSPVLADVRRVLHPPGLALRPNGFGRLLLHGDAFDREISSGAVDASPSTVAPRLLAALYPFVRYLDDALIETAAICIRPIPLDGFTAAGWVPTVSGLYVIVTHSGVTLAPFLAEAAAREVSGDLEVALDPFRPCRFSSPSTG